LLRIIQSPLAGVACSQKLAELVSTHSFTEALVWGTAVFDEGFCAEKAAMAGSSAMPQRSIDALRLQIAAVP
jgi:hypothetical protein